MKHYEINDCNVCLNPDIILEYKSQGVTYQLRAMQCSDGKWIYGHNYEERFGGFYGSSAPVSIRNKHLSYDDMVKDAIEHLIDRLEYHIATERGYGSYTGEDGEQHSNEKLVKYLEAALTWAQMQIGPKQLAFDF